MEVTVMDEMQKYASQWDASAKYFYDEKYYSWMCDTIAQFSCVLEVGCGTGYSTLALAEKGHRIIAIEKNHACMETAKRLIAQHGYLDKVMFLEGDIVDKIFAANIVRNYEYDVVICWNVGSYWSKEMFQYYVPYILEYGLDEDHIRDNPESSYVELIIWDTCTLASSRNKPVHIIERCAEVIDEKTDSYYCELKDNFGYDVISYKNCPAKSLSNGGRMLTTNGTVNRDDIIDIVFVSIYMQ